LLAPHVSKAVVAAAGPYDLRIIAPGWYEALLGASYQEDPQRYHDAGLVDRANEFEAEVLLVHGTHDLNVALAQTMRFSEALLQAGRQHELLVLQNQSHEITGTASSHCSAAARFFRRHLL
jgi:dipeptidyl-peptidase-4